MKIILSLILSVIFISKDNNKATYQLISKCSVIGGCGNLLLAYEFIFLNKSDSTLKIGIIPCPELYGDNYFIEEKDYNIEFTTDSIIKDYSVVNHFEIDSLYIPRLVVRTIERIQ